MEIIGKSASIGSERQWEDMFWIQGSFMGPLHRGMLMHGKIRKLEQLTAGETSLRQRLGGPSPLSLLPPNVIRASGIDQRGGTSDGR